VSNVLLLLARRAVREIWRMPDGTVPSLFLPLFFLAVNVGQISKSFPSKTPFLHGQGYVGFQLPVSLMFGVCTATTGFALVNDIDRGYLDKLLLSPVSRSAIVFGRLAADLVRGVAISSLVLLFGVLVFGVRVRSGIPGAVVLVALAAGWGVASAGLAMIVALRTRSVQATSASFLLFFPLLFLAPNYVPFDRLAPIMEPLARANPVSYVIEGLRSLVLEGWVPEKLAICAAVILATGLVLISLAVMSIKAYER
jgi:ABC-2 type transport system permease protein